MRNTRKKEVKTVYKDDDDEDSGPDFSDSGSEVHISEEASSSDEEVDQPSSDSVEEFKAQPPKRSRKPKVTKPKITFSKSFVDKIRAPQSPSDETSQPLFSVKDLTEADKLLPPVLNLSESDSSDDESPNVSAARTAQSSANVSQNNASSSDTETKADYNDDCFRSCDKESDEIAKKVFMELEQHKTKMEEAKVAVQKYTAEKSAVELDVKDLLAQGEEEMPVIKEIKKTNKKTKKTKQDSDSEMEDWEEVKESKGIPQQGIQLVVAFPDAAVRKSKKVDVEMMMRRKINRVKKEYQVYMHKVHVLCWIGHGNYVSRVLNDPEILTAVLTLVPSKECYPGERVDLKYVEQITQWYKDKLLFKQDKHEDKFRPKAPPLKELLLSQIKSKKTTTKKYLTFIFVSLLRALGLQCRVMFNFVTLPIKPPTSELCSLSTKQNDDKSPKSEEKESKSNLNKDSKSKIKPDKKVCKGKDQKTKTNSAKGKSKALPQVDGIFDSSSDDSDFEDIMQVDGNNDATTKRRSTRTNNTKTTEIKAEKENEDVSPPKRSRLSLKTNIVKDVETKPNKKQTLPDPISGTKSQNKLQKDNKEGKKVTENEHMNKISPRKTRNTQKTDEVKMATKKDKPNIEKTKTKPTGPDINITNADNISSKYFESKDEGTKSANTTRKRSRTTTPKKLTDESKPKVRTKSTPRTSESTSSEYFSADKKTKSSRRRIKDEISEDTKRVSHRDLAAKTKGITNDVTGDLVDIIKKRVKEAKVDTKLKKVKGKEIDSDVDSDYLPEEQIKECPNSDSDADFKPTKLSPKPLIKRPIDRRVLSSDDDTPKNSINVWCEVYVEELEQWVPVDVVRAKVHCANELYKKATQPVTYVVGWDNNNYLKDLTRRYVPHWNTVTRKQRVESQWWDQAVKSWLGPKTARDREEDEGLDRQQLEAPLPKSIAEYKNHPLYALKRHLLKFEVIYPPDAATLGFIRGEAVYARDCVYVCRSRDTWLKEAKVVKLGENPYKIVKARPKWDRLSNKMINDRPLEIFGPWQIKDYEPPTAENGIVPRNAYGNVELFKDCMLPKGTVHMKLPSLNKVAKKLNIDCAPAMTGFDYNGGYSHPVYDGYVVCKEFEETLMEAWLKDQEDQERKEIEKLEARVYGNWRKLIKGLLIRERLKIKYGFDDPETSDNKKKKVKGPKLVVKKRWKVFC